MKKVCDRVCLSAIAQPQRALAGILAIILALSLLPIGGIHAFAEESLEKASEGEGVINEAPSIPEAGSETEAATPDGSEDDPSDDAGEDSFNNSDNPVSNDDEGASENDGEAITDNPVEAVEGDENKEDVVATGSEESEKAVEGEGTEEDGAEISMMAAPTLSGVFTISSALNTNMVVNIAGGSVDDEAAVQLWTANNATAQRFSFSKNSDGTYTIKNIRSGKVLDVQNGKVAEGAKIWQYVSNNTKAQKWIVETASDGSSGYRISSVLDRRYCLSLSQNSATAGTQIQIKKDKGTKDQRFIAGAIMRTIADGTYTITSALTNKVVDVSEASTVDGANIQLYQSNNTLAQRYTFTYDAQSGYYTVVNVYTNKAMDVSGAGMSNGSNVQSYQSNGTYAQKWAITAESSGHYRITAAHSGLVLDISNAGTADGTNIQTYQWNGTKAQRWTVKQANLINDGVVEVKNALGTVLDAANGAKTGGTNIQAYVSNKTFAQKYKVEHVSGGFYKIEGTGSGLVICTTSTNATNVVLGAYNGADIQLWKPIPAGGGRFYFQSKSSGKVLDVAGGSTAAGANVQVYVKNNTKAQQWSLETTDIIPEGLYIVPAAEAPDLVLDVVGGSTDNHVGLQIYVDNGTLAQTFKFTRVGSYYRITNIKSGKAIDVTNGTLDPSTGKGAVQMYTAGGNNNKAQLWRVEYSGECRFNIFSALGNGKSCLDISNGKYAWETPIQVNLANNSPNQEFLLTPTGNMVYENLNFSIAWMIQIQRAGNRYISDLSDQQLRDVIDPTIAMADYSFPGHPRYYGGLYQFADLRSSSGLNAAQLDAIINSTPAGRTGKLQGMGAAFLEAEQTYGLNACYLLAHAVLESWWGLSNLAQGKVPGYTGYYNFFGIGAYDLDPDNGGAALAKRERWDSPRKAVLGAARWISVNYINGASYTPNGYDQPTLYSMRWDYVGTNISGGYGFQYASDHLWARKIARMMDDFYSGQGVSPSLTYIVPRYK